MRREKRSSPSSASSSSVSALVVVAALSALLGACTTRMLALSPGKPHQPLPPAHEDGLQQLVIRQNITIDALLTKLRRVEIADRNEDARTRTHLKVQHQSDEDCETRFGEGLVESYRSSAEVWCQGGLSRMVCYQHTYAHNSRTSMFCEAWNVSIDGSKIKGSKPFSHKPGRGATAYLAFDAGATTVTCEKTLNWRQQLLMPHMALQLRNLVTRQPPQGVRVGGTTYFLARDEDCENMFHSTADHLNAYLVGKVLRLDWRKVRTMLWDRHPDGPFRDLIAKAYSGAGPLGRASELGLAHFDHVIFHLESPAGIVFPKVAGPTGIMRCRGSSLWRGYIRHVLASFGQLNVPPPDIPTVLLSVRRRTPTKNVGRVFANEQHLIDVLRSGNGMRFEVVDLGALSFDEQLRKIRASNVLVGAHGAGLMHVLFLADEAVLLEIHPSYRIDRHFRLAARMAGKIYMPMRSTAPVSCTGTSDAIPIDKAEFERALDAAIRVARSFDDGVAECGLSCDPRILALDPSMKTYLPPDTKALSTQFPC